MCFTCPAHAGPLRLAVILFASCAVLPAGADEAARMRRAEDSAVWTKTSVERADFETCSIVLRDGAILAYY